MGLDLIILATIVPAVIVVIAIFARNRDRKAHGADDKHGPNDSPGSHLG